MLRDLWRAASRPLPFFTRLAQQEPNLPRVALAGLASAAFGLLASALALILATGSDAYLPLLLAVLSGGLLVWLLVAGLGGLVILRPAQLDLRAWELVGWSWAPAGILALSLLPALALAPLIALVLGYVGGLAWHLALLNSALTVFAPQGRRRSLLWYLVAVVLTPWGFFALLLALLLPGAA